MERMKEWVYDVKNLLVSSLPSFLSPDLQKNSKSYISNSNQYGLQPKIAWALVHRQSRVR